MKKIITIIYYIITIIIIIMGFIIGTYSEKIDEGYEVYDYSHKEYSPYIDTYYYPSTEIGDNHVEKYTGWYGFYYTKNVDYYEDNIKIPQKTLEDSTSYRQLYSGGNNSSPFHDVNIINIIISIVYIILLLTIPLIIKLICKIKGKFSDEKQLKKMRKLKEKLDLGIISQENYELEKNKIINNKK